MLRKTSFRYNYCSHYDKIKLLLLQWLLFIYGVYSLFVISTFDLNKFPFTLGTNLSSVDQYGRTPLTLAKSRLKFLSENKGYTSDRMRSEIVEVVLLDYL